jgi:hypothetical protein
MNKLALSLLLLLLALPAVAAPPEILNGGDNGGTVYVDGVTQAGDTVVQYQDTASTPNTAYAVSNRVGVSVVLPLYKEIRDLSGAQIAHASNLFKGQEIYYVLHLWNRMPDQTVSDVRIADALPPEVTFTGPIESFIGSVTGGNPLSSTQWTTNTSWSALGWTAVTTAVSTGDIAGIVGSNLSAGGPSNLSINLTQGQMVAIRFRVRIN